MGRFIKRNKPKKTAALAIGEVPSIKGINIPILNFFPKPGRLSANKKMTYQRRMREFGEYKFILSLNKNHYTDPAYIVCQQEKKNCQQNVVLLYFVSYPSESLPK